MDNLYLVHSAKGSQWKEHKYIKKVGNKYYYKTSDLEKDDREINSSTTDADIIKNSLGEDFDEVQKKVQQKLAETGKTTLTDEEIHEILGDKYDDVKNKILEQADAREETKKETPKKKSSSKSSEEKVTKVDAKDLLKKKKTSKESTMKHSLFAVR